MGGFGTGIGPAPRDILILLGVVFFTFVLEELDSALPTLLRLTPAVWLQGFLWQLLTYPFIGAGRPGIWFLLELLILFWFSRDVFRALGRRRFWKLLAWSAGGAGVLAVLVELAVWGATGQIGLADFVLIQGQRMLLVICIAAFATLYRDATIYFFFVLPIQAKWFLLLEILLGFMGFLAVVQVDGSRDLAGFLGLSTAVGITYAYLTPASARRLTREAWLRFQRWRIQLKLSRIRKRTGIHVVKSPPRSKPRDGDSDKRDPWVN